MIHSTRVWMELWWRWFHQNDAAPSGSDTATLIQSKNLVRSIGQNNKRLHEDDQHNKKAFPFYV
jgi:hypothetical protein